MIESADCPKARRIISSLWRRLPWLTMTPLGAAVEPEVYCRKARASGPGRDGQGLAVEITVAEVAGCAGCVEEGEGGLAGAGDRRLAKSLSQDLASPGDHSLVHY